MGNILVPSRSRDSDFFSRNSVNNSTFFYRWFVDFVFVLGEGTRMEKFHFANK